MERAKSNEPEHPSLASVDGKENAEHIAIDGGAASASLVVEEGGGDPIVVDEQEDDGGKGDDVDCKGNGNGSDDDVHVADEAANEDSKGQVESAEGGSATDDDHRGGDRHRPQKISRKVSMQSQALISAHMAKLSEIEKRRNEADKKRMEDRDRQADQEVAQRLGKVELVFSLSMGDVRLDDDDDDAEDLAPGSGDDRAVSKEFPSSPDVDASPTAQEAPPISDGKDTEIVNDGIDQPSPMPSFVDFTIPQDIKDEIAEEEEQQRIREEMKRQKKMAKRNKRRHRNHSTSSFSSTGYQTSVYSSKASTVITQDVSTISSDHHPKNPDNNCCQLF